jgi:hypothetical protein
VGNHRNGGNNDADQQLGSNSTGALHAEPRVLANSKQGKVDGPRSRHPAESNSPGRTDGNRVRNTHRGNNVTGSQPIKVTGRNPLGNSAMDSVSSKGVLNSSSEAGVNKQDNSSLRNKANMSGKAL